MSLTVSSLAVGLRGIFGKPYVDLAPHLDLHLDLGALDAIHDEICLAFTQVPAGYTGGSHRSMGIMPESRKGEALVDYGEVLREMSDVDFLTFRSLSDDPASIDPHRRKELTYGEERDVPLSRRQMLWLKVRFGVYFPWKAYVELIPNDRWEDKASAEGKSFTRTARAFFPKTIAFIEKLPFRHIGRANVYGLEAHDYGTVHRDGEPDEQAEPDHFVTICPRANKRLFLWDEDAKTKTYVEGRAYWFNDFDYHGVDADPFFRYSLRIDGVFSDDFLERLKA
jgi:hypothetical protein